MSNTILTTSHDNWMEITLNRPNQLNAFNDEMHTAIKKALDKAENPEIRAVVLTGAGRGFCSGQDLEGRDPRKMESPPDLGKTLSMLYNPLVQRLQNLPKPIICAVNGVAAGAGANIAFSCDIILASDSAKFVQSFAKVGLIPDAGGTYHLTKILLDQESPYLRSIVINKGFKHNIKIGSTVRSGSYFVGKVVGVNYLTSRVLLINDLNSKIPVIIEPDGTSAMVSGNGSKIFGDIEYLPEKNQVEEGHIVYTSGTDGIISSGIPVGKIIIKNNQKSVRFFIDFDQIQYVKVYFKK